METRPEPVLVARAPLHVRQQYHQFHVLLAAKCVEQQALCYLRGTLQVTLLFEWVDGPSWNEHIQLRARVRGGFVKAVRHISWMSQVTKTSML